MEFDTQPTLTSDRLELRPLRAEDFDGLYSAASAPEVWAGHPATDRHLRDVFRRYFDFLQKAGGTLVIIDRAEGKVIGCSRYYQAPDMPESISIGFTFLDHTYWGGETNFEMKRLMLGHAFRNYDEVWFHIDPTNLRSQAATAKLGAEMIYDATLDLGGTPAPWLCYRFNLAGWERMLKARAGG